MSTQCIIFDLWGNSNRRDVIVHLKMERTGHLVTCIFLNLLPLLIRAARRAVRKLKK